MSCDRECIYRMRDSALPGAGCGYLRATGQSRVKTAYQKLGIRYLNDEARRLLREDCPCFVSNGKPEKPRKKRRAVRSFDTKLARELYEQGLTDQEIAARVFVSRTRICEWRKAEKLPTHIRRLRHDWEKARAMAEAGAGTAEIARAMGVSEPTVYQWKLRERLQTTRRTGYNWKLGRALYEQGLNDQQIAMRLNCYPGTVEKWRNRNGLASNYTKGRKRRE